MMFKNIGSISDISMVFGSATIHGYDKDKKVIRLFFGGGELNGSLEVPISNFIEMLNSARKMELSRHTNALETLYEVEEYIEDLIKEETNGKD